MAQKLEIIEKCICFYIWTVAVAYSLYQFYLASRKFDMEDDDDYGDFKTEGTLLRNRKKDISDEEWNVIVFYIYKLAPWCLINMVISEILKFTDCFKEFDSQRILALYHISISAAFLLTTIHPAIISILFLQPLIFASAYWLKPNIISLWITGVVVLLSLTAYKYIDYGMIGDISLEDFVTSVIASFWILLRCLSFYVDKLRDPNPKATHRRFLCLLAYCFYLPLIFGGPFVSYDDYYQGSFPETGKRSSFGSRLEFFLKRIIKVASWTLAIEYLLHFFYVGVMRYHLNYVESFDAWTLYGYGYAMGQFFHIKYVVLYGFGSAFAAFDGLKVPALPKCIGRIHVYSDMWKYFDEGFYKFTLSYLYLPLMGPKEKEPKSTKNLKRKVFASCICFLFVYLWHGIDISIFAWTVINFIGITLETLFKCTRKKHLPQIKLSNPLERRIEALFAAPLLIVSAVGNSYFFAGYDIGNTFFALLFRSSFKTNLMLLVIFYSCCHVSMQIRKWEQGKSERRKLL